MTVSADDTSAPAPGEQRLAAWVFVAAVSAATLPLVYHAIRAASGRWVPTGDDAYFTLRSLDVGTAHHPLLGAWSSGSADVDRQVNNLGPLQLDLLAPFTKVAWAGGTAIGVVVVHLLAIAGIVWLSHRLGGTRQVVASALGVTLLAWVIGSEMLITPRQHQFLLISYLCLLVATWASATGDRWAPMVWVGAASLVAQTHLSYPILVAALAVPAATGQLLAWRARVDDRVRFHRAWIAAGVLAVVLWAQTFVDQFFGWGNLSDAFASAGGGDGGGAPAPGIGTGSRIVAGVVVSPRGYARPGFATFDPVSTVGSTVQVAVLVAAWTVLLVGAVVAWRHGRRKAAAGLATVAAALAGAVVDASRLPATQFGLVAANYRWLWPTAALAVVGVASLAVRSTRRAVPIVLAITAGLAVVNLPRAYEIDRPDVYRDGQVAVAAITEQLLDELPRRGLIGPVVVAQDEMYFGHPFGYPLGIVIAELGLDYRFEGARQARRFGEARVADGSEPSRLVLRFGDAAAERFDHPDTVAYAPGTIPFSVTLETGSTPTP